MKFLLEDKIVFHTPTDTGSGRQNNNHSSTSGNVQTAVKKPLDLAEPELDPETAADLLFQELGGIELAEMLSMGTVTGINQNFNVITNLDSLRKEYDPTLLISDFQKGYGGAIQMPIDIFNKIPDDPYFISIQEYDPIDNDSLNIFLLDLIIKLQNIEDDEELEIEVMSNGKIYEVS